MPFWVRERFSATSHNKVVIFNEIVADVHPRAWNTIFYLQLPWLPWVYLRKKIYISGSKIPHLFCVFTIYRSIVLVFITYYSYIMYIICQVFTNFSCKQINVYKTKLNRDIIHTVVVVCRNTVIFPFIFIKNGHACKWAGFKFL